MLVSVAIKNFLSFGEEDNNFTMETGKARGKSNHVIKNRKENLLRFASIFGANSAGKSNFVKGIKFAKNIIVNGISNDHHITQFYNRTDIENKDKETEFIFEFFINGKIYVYQFSMILKEKKFTSESLKCNDKIIFTRNIPQQEASIYIKCKDNNKTQKAYLFFDTLKFIDTALFLTEMNHNKGSLYDERDEINILNDIYKIFDNCIKIIQPTTRVSGKNVLFTKEHNVEKILQDFGFDITEFLYTEDTVENIFRGIPQEISDSIMNDINKALSEKGEYSEAVLHGPDGMIKFTYKDEKIVPFTLRCKHGNYGDFSLVEESDGLRKLLDLLDIILNPKKGNIYIVDEIDRSINALITKEFINYYLNKTVEQNTQLIITTHETRLLDLELLRKDEIWMFDKIKGNTHITALTDYDGIIRSDVKLDASFLDGRYGGVAKIKRSNK